jgi:uncharacterized protein (TIGR02453 family)
MNIQKSTIVFLSDLSRNNNKDWFGLNRSRYEVAKSNFELFVQEIIDGIATEDKILKGLDAKTCMFRINRDIRFSHDKSIYKTHFGAFIVKGGRNNRDKHAGYYLHVEPGNSMIAGGAYMPPSPFLSEIRDKINEEGDKLQRIISDKEFIQNFGRLEGESLSGSPRGYQKNHPYIDLLKMKSFFVMKSISDKEILCKESSDLIIRKFLLTKPLNDFLNEVSSKWS